MREETRLRLERTLRLQRLKRAGAMGLLVGAAGLGMWFQGLDAHVTTYQRHGVVVHIYPVVGRNTQAIQHGVDVDVKLDDGREVHVLVSKAHTPGLGERIGVAEHVHGSGRSTFSWK